MKSRKIMSLIIGIVTAVSSLQFVPVRNVKADGQVPAFPGAVGGGMYATGGRGGEVVHVTNLNDSGEGSFREAVSKPNRIVVFDVSGTIELKGNIIVSDNITIAGQTAPGGSGITLKNYKLGMGGNNIICRYISSRPGPYAATSSGNDAWGGAKGANSIIDHCSMSWTTDEQWGLYSNNEYYTVQYSIIGPADSWGGHSKGIHGFGIMMGNGYLTFDHNLIIHNVSRNFRGKIPGTKTADFTNNIIYDWAYQTAYGTIGHLNYVNNTLKMGNGTTGGKHYVNVDSSTSPQNFKIYLAGNRMLNRDNSVYGDVTYDNWNGIVVKDGLGITKANLVSNSAFQTIVNDVNVSTAMTCESAEASYNHVIDYAGNGISPDLRTAVDKQCAYETKTGTGTLSGTAAYNDADSSQKANLDKYKIQCSVSYEYPAPVLTKNIIDTDNDGMPDEWESVRGLDPNDPTDTNGDYCGQGYTNIEYYINDLTVDSFPAGVVKTSPEVKMKKISAFETIEAEDFDAQSGVQTEENSEGGMNVGYIENGDYIMFRNVDFEDGAKSITVRVAGEKAGIELYLGNLSAAPAAKYDFDGTDGWQDWQDITFNVGTIKGLNNLYIKFTGGEGYLLNIDNFVFNKAALDMSGKYIKDLELKEGNTYFDWYISKNTKEGDKIFVDRDFTYTSLPEILVGAESIRTACDCKNLDIDLAEFTAGEDITAYIALDNRVSTIPAWLADWTKTEYTASTSNDVVFDIYSKEFSKGDRILLGTNGQAAYCIGYTVFAVGKGNSEDIPPIIDPEKVEGDINSDGNADIIDLAMMKKYILGTGELTENEALSAELTGNDSVDVLDYVKLLNIILVV